MHMYLPPWSPESIAFRTVLYSGPARVVTKGTGANDRRGAPPAYRKTSEHVNLQQVASKVFESANVS